MPSVMRMKERKQNSCHVIIDQVNYHFWSWNAAVDHLAAVGSQSDGDGQQGDVDDHALGEEVGLDSLQEESVTLWSFPPSGCAATDCRTNLDPMAGGSIHSSEVFTVKVPAVGFKEVPAGQREDGVEDGGHTGNDLHPQTRLQLTNTGRHKSHKLHPANGATQSCSEKQLHSEKTPMTKF